MRLHYTKISRNVWLECIYTVIQWTMNVMKCAEHKIVCIRGTWLQCAHFARLYVFVVYTGYVLKVRTCCNGSTRHMTHMYTRLQPLDLYMHKDSILQNKKCERHNFITWSLHTTGTVLEGCSSQSVRAHTCHAKGQHIDLYIIMHTRYSAQHECKSINCSFIYTFSNSP